MGTNPYDIPMFGETGVAAVTPETYFCSGFANVTAFETDDGLVLVDTGLPMEADAIATQLREYTEAPVHTAVYTHGHVDHAFGLEAYLLDDQEPPRVIAHQAMADRFDRYERTVGHNEAINSRQFGGSPDRSAVFGGGDSQFGWPEHPPTRYYTEELTLTVGGLTFELTHGRGETDDHTWLYCPERDVLCSGDFVIGVAPNAGNPQKVQRYPWDWAAELRTMAACEPRTLCSGHGPAVVDDPAEIRTRCETAADYLETIVERTLEQLNDGSPPHVDIVHAVELPNPQEPWLAELYDDGEFIVRSVLRYFGGWWTGRPADLKPASRDAIAEELAALAGGPQTFADRAAELAEADRLRLAGHLADLALEAAPTDESIQTAVSDVYETRASEETDLMSSNLFASAATYASEGRPYR